MTPERSKEIIEKWPDIERTEEESKEVWELYDKNVKDFKNYTSFLTVLKWIAEKEI